jgi:hypothetical protein
VLSTAEWTDVLSRAELLSRRRTKTGGHRGLDILHAATALNHRSFIKPLFGNRRADAGDV